MRFQLGILSDQKRMKYLYRLTGPRFTILKPDQGVYVAAGQPYMVISAELSSVLMIKLADPIQSTYFEQAGKAIHDLISDYGMVLSRSFIKYHMLQLQVCKALMKRITDPMDGSDSSEGITIECFASFPTL